MADITAWLPNNPVAQRVNRTEAIKGLCNALGMLDDYTYLHVTRHEKDCSVEWVYPDKVLQFDDEIAKRVEYLYGKYYRLISQSVHIPESYSEEDKKAIAKAVFPADVQPTIYMKPPTNYQFKEMCASEGWIKKEDVK